MIKRFFIRISLARQYSIAIAKARTQKKQRRVSRPTSCKSSHWTKFLIGPARREPRAVKRRPKPYPLLNQPRRQFKEIAHRNRYWKNNPRNARS
jgi:hypothetical protein